MSNDALNHGAYYWRAGGGKSMPAPKLPASVLPTPSPPQAQAPSETPQEQAESWVESHKTRYVNSQDDGNC